MEQYKQMVIGMAMSMLRNEHAAQDVTQHVLMKFHENIDKVQGHEGAWLMTVTKNACIKHMKRSSRYVFREPEEFNDIVDETPSPCEVMEQQEQQALRRKMLHEAMKKIPARQQQLIHMLYHENLSYREMAENLGLTVGNVGFLLNKTRNTLKRLINDMTFMMQHDGGKLEPAGLIYKL